jgi:hypothetical protein
MAEDEEWEPGPALDEDETPPPVGSTTTPDRPTPARSAPGGAGSGRAEAAPKPVYSDLETWMRKHLAQIIRRRFGGSLTWCSQWYRHAEAVSRLNAMWQEWEKAVVEGTMSNWWLYHCDPHLNVLMSKDNGPFMACKPDEHRALEPLLLADSDPMLWLGSAFSDPSPDRGGAAGQAPAGGPDSAARAQTPPGAQMASP